MLICILLRMPLPTAARFWPKSSAGRTTQQLILSAARAPKFRFGGLYVLLSYFLLPFVRGFH